MFWFIIILIVLIILIWLLMSNIRIVPQAHAYILERLGGYKETWGVGLSRFQFWTRWPRRFP